MGLRLATLALAAALMASGTASADTLVVPASGMTAMSGDGLSFVFALRTPDSVQLAGSSMGGTVHRYRGRPPGEVSGLAFSDCQWDGCVDNMYVSSCSGRKNGCDLFEYDYDRRLRELPGASAAGCSERAPAVNAQGEVLFARSGACRRGLYRVSWSGRPVRVSKRVPIAIDATAGSLAYAVRRGNGGRTVSEVWERRPSGGRYCRLDRTTSAPGVPGGRIMDVAVAGAYVYWSYEESADGPQRLARARHCRSTGTSTKLVSARPFPPHALNFLAVDPVSQGIYYTDIEGIRRADDPAPF